MLRSLCLCPLGVRALKAPTDFKNLDQPQLEPSITPLSIGPAAGFKPSLWLSVAWAALLEESWSSSVLVTPALGCWAPWFGPWPSDFTLDCCSAVDLPGNSWNWSWCVGLTLPLHIRAAPSQWPCPVIWTLSWMWTLVQLVLSLQYIFSLCSGN